MPLTSSKLLLKLTTSLICVSSCQDLFAYTLEQTGSITVGQGPTGVALYGETGVCAVSQENIISIFNIKTGLVTGSFSTGNVPTDVAYDGTICVASNFSSNFATIKNFVTGATYSIILPDQTGYNTVALSGTIAAVVNGVTSKVYTFNPYDSSSNFQTFDFTNSGSITSIALNGTLAALPMNGGTVHFFDIVSGATYGNIPLSGGFLGVALSDTACIVTSDDQAKIYFIDPIIGTVTASVSALQAQFASINGTSAAVTYSGYVEVFDITNLYNPLSLGATTTYAPTAVALNEYAIAVCNEGPNIAYGTTVSLFTSPVPFTPPAPFTIYGGNAGVVAGVLNQIDGHCPDAT
jgi:hypothetical protein